MILEWAAAHGRILLTHDRKTMPGYAYDRVRQEQAMPGVLIVNRTLSVGVAIDGILLASECSFNDEWENQVRYLPL